MRLPAGLAGGLFAGLLLAALLTLAAAGGPLRLLSFFLAPYGAAATLLGFGLVIAGLYAGPGDEKRPGGRGMVSLGAALLVQFTAPVLAAIGGPLLVAHARQHCRDAAALADAGERVAFPLPDRITPLLMMPPSSGRYPPAFESDGPGQGRCVFADPFGVRVAWIGEYSGGAWTWERLMD